MVNRVSSFFPKGGHYATQTELKMFIIQWEHMVNRKPVEAKVEASLDFPVYTGKRKLMLFVGMTVYYRTFCNNFSVIAKVLTNLLGKRVEYVWTDDCQKSFDKLKAILESVPVLLAPSFDKEYKLAVYVSDSVAGSVLLHEDDNSFGRPVSYFSK